jgi:Predicted peptidyl-prolyl cis-trans isomerase (rotamase), cyclophilin family
MVDMTNPTSQFHPYQPETSTPATDNIGVTSPTSGLGGILSKLGIDQSKIGALGSKLNGTNVRGGLNNGLNSVRGMAQKNPSLVLGGLAALAIGAGLMRKRGMAR